MAMKMNKESVCKNLDEFYKQWRAKMAKEYMQYDSISVKFKIDKSKLY